MGAPDEPGDDDLAELRRLHEAATPGPWAWEATGDKDNSWGLGVVEDADGNLIAGHNESGENEVIEPVCESIDGNHADAALIVAMRNALPGLLAEVERLRAECDAAVRAVADSDLLGAHAEGVFHGLRAATDQNNWTCPPCRRDDHDTCMDAGTGTCRCTHVRAAAPASEDDLTERFRKALMAAHADDWAMDTVSEAAHACAEHLMALLSAEPAPPLWSGETQPPPRPRTNYAGEPVTGSFVLAEFDDVPPGTAVEVREKRP